MARSLAAFLVAVGVAGAFVAGCPHRQCDGEGNACDAGACATSAEVRCDGGTPVCSATAKLADGMACESTGTCADGICFVVCRNTRACVPPSNPCRAGTATCHGGYALNCTPQDPVAREGEPCGDGGTCSAGDCTCTVEGDRSACPGTQLCDRTPGTGALRCRTECKFTFNLECGEQAVCTPAFDGGGQFAYARCLYSRAAGQVDAGQPCVTDGGAPACLTNATCVAEADGGATCHELCLRADPHCPGGSASVCTKIDDLLGYCQPR